MTAFIIIYAYDYGSIIELTESRKNKSINNMNSASRNRNKEDKETIIINSTNDSGPNIAMKQFIHQRFSKTITVEKRWGVPISIKI